MKPPLRRWRALLARRSNRPGHLPLGVEIAIIVVLKIAVLLALRQAFFAAPQAPHMHMPAERVSAHLFAGDSAAPVSNVKPQGLP